MENNEKITNPSFEHYKQAKVLYRFIEHHGIKLSDEEFIKYFENQTGRNIEKCMPFVKSNADFPENITMDGEPRYISFEADLLNKVLNAKLSSEFSDLQHAGSNQVRNNMKTVYYARIIEIQKPVVTVETINKLI